MALNWLAKGARGLFLCACECLCVGVCVCVRRQCVIAAAVKGRQPDVEIERCENGSHNGGTSLVSERGSVGVAGRWRVCATSN